MPLSSYQVTSSSKLDLNGRLGSANSSNKRILPNLEALKELALQHQSDIFALGDNKNKDHNRMVIYGVLDPTSSRSHFSKLDEPSRFFDESCFEKDFYKESTLLTNRSRQSIIKLLFLIKIKKKNNMFDSF